MKTYELIKNQAGVYELIEELENGRFKVKAMIQTKKTVSDLAYELQQTLFKGQEAIILYGQGT